jgi:aerobic C4-dicarboxylate transport protein
MRVVPVEGVAILLGVDRFMSEARAITNLIGNGAATLVIARSENAFVAPTTATEVPGTEVASTEYRPDAPGSPVGS